MKHCLFLLPVLFCHALLPAQQFDEQFDHWPVTTRIGGTLVLADSLDDFSILTKTVRSLNAGSTVRILIDGETPFETTEALTTAFSDARVTLTIYSADAKAPNAMRQALQKAVKVSDVVCWHSPPELSADRIKRAMGAGDVLQKYLDGGGRLILLGGVASLSGQLSEQTTDELQDGMNLLPNAILQVSAPADQNRMLRRLEANARTVGVHLEPNTALILGGRIVRILGAGSATFILPASEFHEVRTQTLTEPQRRQRPPEFLVDWTEWRRDSIDRTLPQFPPAKPRKPLVENGTLLIVGGGGLPGGLMKRFVQLAGGTNNAKLVYVPCSESAEVAGKQQMVSAWRSMGVKTATFIHTKDRIKANTDEEFLAPLKDATGVWFGGGRQWNMADSYYGTKAHRLMKDVLRRGGVIGGSSAGASIQARYLARATPIENFRIMAPGYERGGLGFIGGVAIDQHFSQRGRQKDMTQLVNRYPQMLGIGLDEATAIEVQKSVAKVVGRGKVFFYDRGVPYSPGEQDYVSLPAGSVYNLASRQVVADTTELKSERESRDAKVDEK